MSKNGKIKVIIFLLSLFCFCFYAETTEEEPRECFFHGELVKEGGCGESLATQGKKCKCTEPYPGRLACRFEGDCQSTGCGCLKPFYICVPIRALKSNPMIRLEPGFPDSPFVKTIGHQCAKSCIVNYNKVVKKKREGCDEIYREYEKCRKTRPVKEWKKCDPIMKQRWACVRELKEIEAKEALTKKTCLEDYGKWEKEYLLLFSDKLRKRWEGKPPEIKPPEEEIIEEEPAIEEEYYISFTPEKSEVIADGKSQVTLNFKIESVDREGKREPKASELVKFVIRDYRNLLEDKGKLSASSGRTDAGGNFKVKYRAPEISQPEFKGGPIIVQAIHEKGNPQAYINVLPLIAINKISSSPKIQEEGGTIRIFVDVIDPINREKEYIFRTKYGSFVKDGKEFGATRSITSKENTLQMGWIAPRGVSAIDVTTLPSLKSLMKGAATGVAMDMVMSGCNTAFSYTKTATKMGMASDFLNPGNVVGAPAVVGFGVADSAKAMGETTSGWAQYGYACNIVVDGAATFVGIVTAPLKLSPALGTAKDAAISTAANGAKVWFTYFAKYGEIAQAKELTVTYPISIDVVDLKFKKKISSHHPLYVKAYMK